MLKVDLYYACLGDQKGNGRLPSTGRQLPVITLEI